MAFVLFADSFSRYKVATLSDAALFDNFMSRYTSIGGLSLIAITAAGRNGQGLNLTAGANVFKTLDHSNRWVTGFAYQPNGAAFGNDAIYAIANNDKPLFNLIHNSDGTLTLRAGNSNVIATTNRSLQSSRWYYLETDVTFGGSAPITCTAELRINGHVEISGTKNTVFNASDLLSNDATGNSHVWAGLGGINSASFDDLYVKNTSGYYGDIRIVALYPNGDGATLQWTPNSGTVHFDRVNTHPVDLTKYVFETVVNNQDTWDWENCPGFSGTIKAINISALSRKDDEGTKAFAIVVGNTGSEAQSQTFYISDVSPEYYEFSLENDPATGVPWTQAGFNAKQFGVKLIA